MDKPIIEVKNIKKRYITGQIGRDTLKADVQTWFARLRGKEDPHSIIGQENRLSGSSFMALNGISLAIKRGEALGVIGANGAGKSTLLKLISRITTPTEGEIVIRGRVSSMLEVGTGFHLEMTGRENIYLNGAILGMTTSEIDSKISDIIEFSECADFIDTPVKRYSVGMTMRLAFAVASHLNGDIIIMDEVLAVGDAQFQKKCIDWMSDSVRDENKTLLYVSHNMNTVRQLCSRCIVLNEGKLVYDGLPEQAIKIYANTVQTIEFEKDIGGRNPTGREVVWLEYISIQNLDREDKIFFTGDHMEVSLVWRALNTVEGADLSIILEKNMVAVGRASSGPVLSGEAGRTYRTKFILDLKTVAEGYYRINISIGRWMQRSTVIFDFCNGAIGFEVQRYEDKVCGYSWRADWGDFVLPELMIASEVVN